METPPNAWVSRQLNGILRNECNYQRVTVRRVISEWRNKFPHRTPITEQEIEACVRCSLRTGEPYFSFECEAVGGQPFIGARLVAKKHDKQGELGPVEYIGRQEEEKEEEEEQPQKKQESGEGASCSSSCRSWREEREERKRKAAPCSSRREEREEHELHTKHEPPREQARFEESCSLQQQQQQQQQRPSLVKQLLERIDRSQELEQKRLELKRLEREMAFSKLEAEGDAMAAELEQKRRDEDMAEGDAIAAELEQKRLEREKAFSQARQILRHARAKFLARPSR